jgi:hypothetical protein
LKVKGGTTATYTANALWNDLTTSDVTADTWAIIAAADSIVAGLLTTEPTDFDRLDTLTATYTYGGVTKSGSLSVIVAARVLYSLVIGCGTPVLGGESTACSANALFDDFTSADVTNGTVWTNAPLTYASIGPTGILSTAPVPSNQNVTVTGSYTLNGITKTNSQTVVIALAVVPLKSIAIAGPAEVTAGKSAAFTVTATFADGSTAKVTPTWSVAPATHAAISAAGVLSTSSVKGGATVTVTASYTLGGVTETASKAVTISANSAGGCAAAGTESVSGSGFIGLLFLLTRRHLFRGRSH